MLVVCWSSIGEPGCRAVVMATAAVFACLAFTKAATKQVNDRVVTLPVTTGRERSGHKVAVPIDSLVESLISMNLLFQKSQIRWQSNESDA